MHFEAHQLCVELGQAGLALAIEDQKRVDHGERSKDGAPRELSKKRYQRPGSRIGSVVDVVFSVRGQSLR